MPDRQKINLRELVAFELLLEEEALTDAFGKNWKPLTRHINKPLLDLFADRRKTELAEVIQLWQDAFEWKYYDSVPRGVLLSGSRTI